MERMERTDEARPAPPALAGATVAIASLDPDLAAFLEGAVRRVLPDARVVAVHGADEALQAVSASAGRIDAVLADAALHDAVALLDGVARRAPDVRRILVVPRRLADAPLRAGNAHVILAAPLDAGAVGRLVLDQVVQQRAARPSAVARPPQGDRPPPEAASRR